ncbi:hypothetical protein BD289DRAFT_480651 [Coniella lustricola]|uniref:AB hydrolase-1 domain-containing protein n=1 Tax=Coniella lustricola TaxID=2025994 RepID=A0A2T3AF23_9PEZI|nr:hypothetical protein BD289DRAFT_480651 [Coniella lustricola]
MGSDWCPWGQVFCRPGRRGYPAIFKTAQVVEDTVELIEQEGVWRAKEAIRLLSIASGDTEQANKSKEARRHTAYQPGEEKIRFLGDSYGTTIGSIFADMQPDKIRRTILDGNMDPADHHSGIFDHSLQNSDKNHHETG